MISNTEYYYLKEDVYFEPLVNKWYAWPHLISPVTQVLHMIKNHRRIMSSFTKNAKLHALAIAQPNMAGGEFVDCSEEKVGDIEKLVRYIDEELGSSHELLDALSSLEALLKSHTSGESIEYIYQKIGKPLAGFVEIVMDMSHNPSFRLIEPLLYRSKYYREELQEVMFGLVDERNERPFAFSTPRLPEKDTIQRQISFKDLALNDIFQARTKPILGKVINDFFAVESCEGELSTEMLFTNVAPLKRHEKVQDKVKLTYLGHAGFMVETDNTCILVDPVIASRVPTRMDDFVSYSELPEKIDYILITHTHSDHTHIETLLQLRHKTNKVLVPKNNSGFIADPSIKLMLDMLGFSVMEFDDMERIELDLGYLMAIPFLGEHGDLNIRSKTAWLVNLKGKTIYFGADSSNLEPRMYEHIKKDIGDIDIMAIGMECVGAPYTWVYGALCNEPPPKNIKDSRRLNGSGFEQAYGIASIFEPKEIFIYALGLEPWYKYFMGIVYNEDSEQIIQSNMMIEKCKNDDIPVEKMYGKYVTYLE